MAHSRSIGDALLTWASEEASGTWGRFRDTAAFLLSRTESRIRPWYLAHQLSALGHLDLDWDSREWSVSEPALVLSPGMASCAYLAGWRTAALLRRFHEASDDPDLYPFCVDQGHAPRAIFLKASDPEAIAEAARRLNARLVVDPASQLAERGRLERPAALATPPPIDEELEVFDGVNLCWTSASGRDTDGLYRFDLHGRKTHRLRTAGEWYLTELPDGLMAILEGRGDIVHWRPTTPGLELPRSVLVHQAVALPTVSERALVSASGLLPEREGDHRVYRNVSRDVARRVCDTLGLELGFEPGRARKGTFK